MSQPRFVEGTYGLAAVLAFIFFAIPKVIHENWGVPGGATCHACGAKAVQERGGWFWCREHIPARHLIPGGKPR